MGVKGIGKLIAAFHSGLLAGLLASRLAGPCAGPTMGVYICFIPSILATDFRFIAGSWGSRRFAMTNRGLYNW